MENLFSQGITELKNKLIDTTRRNKLINYKYNAPFFSDQ